MIPDAKATTAGMTQTVRHAFSASPLKKTLKRGKRPAPMMSWVTPPPRLPQPSARALAIPTTSFANILEDQNWHMTKVEPATPMKKRRIAKLRAELTKPVIAVGMEEKQRTTANEILGPYLSQTGPCRKKNERCKLATQNRNRMAIRANCEHLPPGNA
jgi:hypothetical protein